MKPRDLLIGIIFVHVSLFLFLGSLRLVGSPLTVAFATVPGWLPACYSAALLASSLGVVLRQAWARIVAFLFILPLIPLFVAPLVTARGRDIFGGTGPDANPMASVALLILGACVVASLLFTGLLVWLLLIHLTRNERNT